MNSTYERGSSLTLIIVLLLGSSGTLLFGYWLGYQAGVKNWEPGPVQVHPARGLPVEMPPPLSR